MMTCRQMGGPCDAKFQGKSPEEILSHASSHVEHLANIGDEAHRKVLLKMEEMHRNPHAPETKAWNEHFKKDFEELPTMH
jgi:hypothetical protein